MLKVGLTGGLACGKTFIANEFERLGCAVIHADVLGHEVLAPGGEAFGPVVELFGSAILDGEGLIDRTALAALVFRHRDRLSALNGIVHPAVRRLEEERIAAILRNEPNPIVVVEAAILIEAGLAARFERLVIATCDGARQIERALERDPNARREDVVARMELQMPTEEKLKYADFVIDTSGTREETVRQTEMVFGTLRKLADDPLRAGCQNGKEL